MRSWHATSRAGDGAGTRRRTRRERQLIVFVLCVLSPSHPHVVTPYLCISFYYSPLPDAISIPFRWSVSSSSVHLEKFCSNKTGDDEQAKNVHHRLYYELKEATSKWIKGHENENEKEHDKMLTLGGDLISSGYQYRHRKGLTKTRNGRKGRRELGEERGSGRNDKTGVSVSYQTKSTREKTQRSLNLSPGKMGSRWGLEFLPGKGSNIKTDVEICIIKGKKRYEEIILKFEIQTFQL